MLLLPATAWSYLAKPCLVHDLWLSPALTRLKESLQTDSMKLFSERTLKRMKQQEKHYEYKVTAIVSTYRSEIFMEQCLDDLLSQTLSDDLEIIVIDSGSPESEGDIVRKYQRNHRNILYERTERETLYQAWNRAVRLSHGKYLTNANTDDRHSKTAFEILAHTLDEDPNIALVYSDQKISRIRNETFEECSGEETTSLPEFDRRTLLKTCLTGSQPMWRSSVHQIVGHFSENLKIAGDYEMWLRLAQYWEFKKISEVVGQYFYSERGLEKANQYLCDLESLMLRKKYLHLLGIDNIPDALKELGDSTFNKGYDYILQGEIEKSKEFMKSAIAFHPTHLRYYKTYFVRVLLKMRHYL